MKLKQLIIFFFIALLPVTNVTASNNSSDVRPQIRDMHFFAYLIYDNALVHEILYSDFYIETDADGADEAVGISGYISKNMFSTHSQPAYEDFEFELQSTGSDKKRRFKIKLEENNYYYFLISEDKSGMPTVTRISEAQGIALLKSAKRFEWQ